ncbi:family 43 glycosylhydrolase [Opitutales bacterium ASA1]|nr:family 43 glycosylhydrolase [Opitutales bacterium ASA1]
MRFSLLSLACIGIVVTAAAESGPTYVNPIISGDWSDPGVVRVGEDYYTVRSTFGWQPGIAIAHSRDLVHWRQIGHVFESHEKIAPGDTRHGIWGLDAGIHPVTGHMLVYAPTRDAEIYVYRAERPEGPYERRSLGPDIGIDPGFFADDDGRLYIVTSRAVIHELASDGMSIAREVLRIDRSRYKLFEGPAIYKRGPWYYLLFSDGGTLPHEPSTISVLRAPAITGPWEEDPGNPVMFATGTGTTFEGPAHGALLEMDDGRWYLIYHAHEPSHYSLGRQMLMEPVEWTEDGWWRPVGGRVPSTTPQRAPLPLVPTTPVRSDAFDAPALGPQWFFLCEPDRSGGTWSLSDRPGVLRLYPPSGDIGSLEALPAIFQQSVNAKRFSFETRLEFAARETGEAAGIHLYHDPLMNVWLASTLTPSGRVIEVGKHNLGERTVLWTVPHPEGDRVQLRIEVDGEESARFFFRPDDAAASWRTIGDEVYFGASGHHLRDGKRGDPDLGWVGRYKDRTATRDEIVGRAGPKIANRGGNIWTGTTFGVFAARGEAPAGAPADFDYFLVEQP